MASFPTYSFIDVEEDEEAGGNDIKEVFETEAGDSNQFQKWGRSLTNVFQSLLLSCLNVNEMTENVQNCCWWWSRV